VSLTPLDIYRTSDDANVGQTLLRLARLAAAAHGLEAIGAGESGGRGGLLAAAADGQIQTSQRRVEGLDPMPVVKPPSVERHAGASAGKEAGR
jgi:hypothetical protein